MANHKSGATGDDSSEDDGLQTSSEIARAIGGISPSSITDVMRRQADKQINDLEGNNAKGTICWSITPAGEEALQAALENGDTVI